MICSPDSSEPLGPELEVAERKQDEIDQTNEIFFNKDMCKTLRVF
jgi:hypothetical protein